MKKPFEPNFNTPEADLCKEELNKINKEAVFEQMSQEMNDDSFGDVAWEVEQIAKSFGFYLEFDRAKKGEKDWMFMIRIANPGGGPLSPAQYKAYDELSEKHGVKPNGVPTLRATTRQTFQFHWIDKKGVIDICKTMAEVGQSSLNGCGDNTRNVMACPLSRFSDVFNANELALKLGAYFQLPVEPFVKTFNIDPEKIQKPEQSFNYGPRLLNRKFKIGVGAVHRNSEGALENDNCIEALTNDLAVIPILDGEKVERFQIYVGGGQGERNGKPSGAMLGQPLGIVSADNVLKACDAVVQAHQKVGDRQNRHWARLKYVVKKQGVEWFKNEVEAFLDFKFDAPITDLDVGSREMHHGWWQQPSNGLWSYGIFIENGRIEDDSPNGKIKSMLREIMSTLDVEMSISPSQDIFISNITEDKKDAFEAILAKYNYGNRNGKPFSTLRKIAGACVGLDTCRLSYTESEKFVPVLVDQLEELGWGDMSESIGITGCERQCYRPATKAIGLVGTGANRYMFKLFGDSTGKFQGRPLIVGEELHLRSVMREDVPVVIDTLFNDYKANANDGEGLGAYHRRIGDEAIVSTLKTNEKTASL